MAFDNDTAGDNRDQLPEDLYAIIAGHRNGTARPKPGPVSPKIFRLTAVRAVIFDVYGTLFQSAVGEISLHFDTDPVAPFRELVETAGAEMDEGRVTELTGRYYEKIGEVHESRRALNVEYPEVDVITIWHGLCEEFPELIIDSEGDRFSRARRLALLYELAANPVDPMPGAAETLRSLRDRGQFLGVISNAQFYTPLLFRPLLGGSPEELGIALAIWSYEEGEAKPSDRLYSKAVSWFSKAYGLEAHQLLMVGNDMRNDVVPAAAVGMRTALFGGDRRSLRLRGENKELSGVSPDVVLTDLRQLNEVVS